MFDQVVSSIKKEAQAGSRVKNRLENTKKLFAPSIPSLAIKGQTVISPKEQEAFTDHKATDYHYHWTPDTHVTNFLQGASTDDYIEVEIKKGDDRLIKQMFLKWYITIGTAPAGLLSPNYWFSKIEFYLNGRDNLGPVIYPEQMDGYEAMIIPKDKFLDLHQTSNCNPLSTAYIGTVGNYIVTNEFWTNFIQYLPEGLSPSAFNDDIYIRFYPSSVGAVHYNAVGTTVVTLTDFEIICESERHRVDQVTEAQMMVRAIDALPLPLEWAVPNMLKVEYPSQAFVSGTAVDFDLERFKNADVSHFFCVLRVNKTVTNQNIAAWLPWGRETRFNIVNDQEKNMLNTVDLRYGDMKAMHYLKHTNGTLWRPWQQNIMNAAHLAHLTTTTNTPLYNSDTFNYINVEYPIPKDVLIVPFGDFTDYWNHCGHSGSHTVEDNQYLRITPDFSGTFHLTIFAPTWQYVTLFKGIFGITSSR